MATILKADGSVVVLKGEDPKGRLTLAQMQQGVGGYARVVKLRADKLQMVVDEDACFKSVPVNETATQMYRRNTGYVGEVIRGDVILCEYRSLR